MKKILTTCIVLLFSMFIMVQEVCDLAAQSPADSTNATATKDTVSTYRFIHASPKEVGINPVILDRIGPIVESGMIARAFPGCQVLVLKDGKTIYDKCFGYYTYEQMQKVTPHTLYDLASLSKTTGTLLAIMKLYDEGKISLTDKASQYLPFLQNTDKENITIKDLLFHESGLPASLSCFYLVTTKDTMQVVRMGNSKFKENWIAKTPSLHFMLQVTDSFYLHNSFHEAAMQKIADTRLRSKTYLYSCINFILLKEIAETISGKSMDVFLDSAFYAPMGLKDIVYLPLRTHRLDDIAPTLKKDYLRNGVIQGYVHDPDAAFLGGISGNAGLFATAKDVAMVYQMLLNNGELEGKRYLSAETCRIFTTTTSASGRRGLAFDKPVPSNPSHSPCSISTPGAVYGHTGYTGTCCWVDPVNNLVYVFLSNRTYPNDGVNKLARMGIRTKIQETIYNSMLKK